MNLYTFIMELDGGTYIKQVEAQNEAQAVWDWLARKITPKIPTAVWNALKEDIRNDFYYGDRVVTKISRTKNVWCLTAHAKIGRRSHHALINIVKTEHDRAPCTCSVPQHR